MIACPIMLSQAALCWASLSLGRRPLPGYWWWPPAPSPGNAEHTDETELFSDSLLAQLYLLQLSSSRHDVKIDKTVKTSQRLHFRQNYFILSNMLMLLNIYISISATQSFFFFLIWLYWCEHSHAGENVFEKVWWESHQIDFKHLNKIHLMNINNIIEIKSLTYLQDLMSSRHPVYFHWKTASWEERLIYHECCLHFYYRILFHNYLLKNDL